MGGVRTSQTSHDTAKQHTGDDRGLRDGGRGPAADDADEIAPMLRISRAEQSFKQPNVRLCRGEDSLDDLHGGSSGGL